QRAVPLVSRRSDPRGGVRQPPILEIALERRATGLGHEALIDVAKQPRQFPLGVALRSPDGRGLPDTTPCCLAEPAGDLDRERSGRTLRDVTSHLRFSPSLL